MVYEQQTLRIRETIDRAEARQRFDAEAGRAA